MGMALFFNEFSFWSKIKYPKKSKRLFRVSYSIIGMMKNGCYLTGENYFFTNFIFTATK